MNPTVQSSTSGMTSERETPYQQRGNGNLTPFADTTVYTQRGAAEMVGLGPQQLSADILSTYRSSREYRELLGIGSQISNTGIVQYEPRTTHVEAFPCPYHGPILQERLPNLHPDGLGPMDRYLAEGPSEQHAIFYRPDTGNFSTFKGCRCIEKMQSSINTDDYATK